jgi:hypothetical protein
MFELFKSFNEKVELLEEDTVNCLENIRNLFNFKNTRRYMRLK